MTDTTRDLLIILASHMAYMQGQLEARHELDDPEDFFWYRESVLLRQKVADHLAAEAQQPSSSLTELRSSPPTVSDYADFAAWLAREMPAGTIIGDPLWWAPRIARRAAQLLQRQALVPVSVSERPWEREGWCDAEGKCWIRGKVEGDWRLINPTNSGVPNLKYCFTHCLPAHALPLPEVGE